MVEQSINYHRVARAIDYINENLTEQPSLDEIAAAVGISRYYFQRTFSEWAGVSPKKFIQYLSIEYAKQLLETKRLSLLDVACRTGLSGTSRLHDLFVNIESMTPGEFRNGGETLAINYSFYESPFGKIIIASTSKGICHLFFEENEAKATVDLQRRFPNARFDQVVDRFQMNALRIFNADWQKPDQVKLHLRGTTFQLKVWQALLKIPMGTLETYGHIAKTINNPNAPRAVGSAIGRNPVALLIPCHRVIQATGQVGGYMWGSTRKSAVIGWEAAKSSNSIESI